MNKNVKDIVEEVSQSILKTHGIKEFSHEEEKNFLEPSDENWKLFREIVLRGFLYSFIANQWEAEDAYKSFLEALSYESMSMKQAKISSQGEIKPRDQIRDLKSLSRTLFQNSRFAKDLNERGIKAPDMYIKQLNFSIDEMDAMSSEIKKVFMDELIHLHYHDFVNLQGPTDKSLLFQPCLSRFLGGMMPGDYERSRDIPNSVKRITSNLKLSLYYNRKLFESESMPSETTLSHWFLFDRLLDSQLNHQITSENLTRSEARHADNGHNYIDVLALKKFSIRTNMAQILNTSDMWLRPKLRNLKRKILNKQNDEMLSNLKSTFIKWPKAEVNEITIENIGDNMPDTNHILYIIHTEEKNLTPLEKQFKDIFLGEPEYFKNKYPDLKPDKAGYFDSFRVNGSKYGLKAGLAHCFSSAPEPEMKPENYILTDEELKLVENFSLRQPSKFKIMCKSWYAYIKCCSALQRVNYPNKWRRKQIIKIIAATTFSLLGLAALGTVAASFIMGLALAPIGILAATAVAGTLFAVLGIKKIVQTSRELKKQKLEQERKENTMENVVNEEEKMPKNDEIAQENQQMSQNENKTTEENPQEQGNSDNNELHELPAEKLENKKEENEKH